jgi:hypothetical protein
MGNMVEGGEDGRFPDPVDRIAFQRIDLGNFLDGVPEKETLSFRQDMPPHVLSEQSRGDLSTAPLPYFNENTYLIPYF